MKNEKNISTSRVGKKGPVVGKQLKIGGRKIPCKFPHMIRDNFEEGKTIARDKETEAGTCWKRAEEVKDLILFVGHLNLQLL